MGCLFTLYSIDSSTIRFNVILLTQRSKGANSTFLKKIHKNYQSSCGNGSKLSHGLSRQNCTCIAGSVWDKLSSIMP